MVSNGTSPAKVKVAVTQAEPVWLDLQATVAKTIKLIEEAASNGAALVTFPECWVTGYPAWIWSRPVDFDMTTIYTKNSLAVDSPEMERICAAARDNSISVSMGFSENHHNSLYIAQVTISATGEILMKRRKLKPTHMERTVFGDGSGDSLKNVVDVPGIGRVGALACWEHCQPLLKYHECTQRVDVHVGAWPPLYAHPGGPFLWSMSREGCRNLSQTFAVESQAFVLHTTAVLSQAGIDKMGVGPGLFGQPGGGSSAIFGPDGRQLSKEIPETEEGILYAELDFDEMYRAKGFLDICGHYSRPDLMWLGVDHKEKTTLRAQEHGVNGAETTSSEKKVVLPSK